MTRQLPPPQPQSYFDGYYMTNVPNHGYFPNQMPIRQNDPIDDISMRFNRMVVNDNNPVIYSPDPFQNQQYISRSPNSYVINNVSSINPSYYRIYNIIFIERNNDNNQINYNNFQYI